MVGKVTVERRYHLPMRPLNDIRAPFTQPLVEALAIADLRVEEITLHAL